MDHQPFLTTAYMFDYLIFILMFLITITSVFGNLLVCLAICMERKLRKLCNWFLISLAMADLLVGLIVMTFALISSMKEKWIFGKLLCRLYISFDVMCCTASILNLCAITTDRFLHIKDPYNYDKYMNRKVVLLSITLIWLLSAIISFVPLHFGWHKLAIFQDSDLNDKKIDFKNSSFSLADEKQIISNDNSKCDLEFSLFYAVVSSSISFYLPCIVMVALYTRLYLYARRHAKDIRRTCKPLNIQKKINHPINLMKKQNSNNELLSLELKPNSLETCSTNNKIDRNSQNFSEFSENIKPSSINQQIVDHKAEFTIGVIMGTFLLCWVPFFIINILLSFREDLVPITLFEFFSWLGWANSAINPIIYSIFNREFRSAFHKILTTWFLGSCSLFKNKRLATNKQNFSKNKHFMPKNTEELGNEKNKILIDKKSDKKNIKCSFKKNLANSNCVDEIDLKIIDSDKNKKDITSKNLTSPNIESITELNGQKKLMVSIQKCSTLKNSVVV